MENQIGALVDFDQTQMGVFVMDEKKSENEKHGEIILFSTLIFRMLSLSRSSEVKSSFIQALSEGAWGLTARYVELWDIWNDDMKQNINSLRHSADSSTKRGFALFVSYDKDKHVTRLKPRGFGILGKNIELASFMAIGAVHEFLKEKYKDDSEYLDILDRVIIDCTQVVAAKGGKLGIQDEYHFSEAVAENYYPYMKH